jgi:hypothetical protein
VTCPQAGWGVSNTGPFQNVQSNNYWSATAYAPNPNNAWFFNFDYGFMAEAGKSNEIFAWAVRNGDIAAVPEPSTLALLGMGLVGLGFARRRKVS